MADFDNIFDEAMSQADDTIRRVMGGWVTVTSGALAGVTLSGVFDDPENVGYAVPGIRVEGTSPSLFLKTATVSQLARLDTLDINGKPFWVDRIGPDDCGSCHVWLGSGPPPAEMRRRRE
ncbi:phage tail protein [Salmonella enterica]|uniref:Phage tail protein n=1 Tax=Salmonella enterica TaxID=28901 RepID=A0A3J2D502_SALER|nr:phage tail protein [Salmonella enterica]ECU4768795.1 phage tail protein [Salmonella enterica subsp. enterica]EDQ1017306.1 phage tail protein [Salmonella enterica subsp. houtenae serovar 50:z4,z23:-]EDV3252703.1 phage tail protein [Salmonella enterica subsp. houtenae]EDW0441104.1 phage tail protein [Salmonella enterica subsp. arizonae serovar 50:z4,z23:-]HAE7876315.1 phage tail protein [Salmonella enterica subsp. enterica serovar 1,9,12:-:-]